MDFISFIFYSKGRGSKNSLIVVLSRLYYFVVNNWLSTANGHLSLTPQEKIENPERGCTSQKPPLR